ncbi:MAG: hypothetical protein JRG89_18370 [Deltaproteobacteria bacterium]|nr:hypothetical protein [Deltaproteobacteria bacterium]
MTTPQKGRLDRVRVPGMSCARRLLIYPVFVFASLMAPALASNAIADPAKPSLAELLDGTILEKKVGDILKGEKVSVAAPETTRREMAVGIACLIPPGRTTSLELFHNSEAIMPEDYRDTSGPIDPANPEAGLATLEFGKNGRGEVKRYLSAEPGWEISLSSEEIAGFRALEPKAGEEHTTVEAELRRMLAERVRSYHLRGLAGIADFDRGEDGKSSVSQDLRDSTVASVGIQKRMPTAYRALTAYPLIIEGVEGKSFYFWTRARGLGRTLFMLNQRLTADVDGGSIVVERQFYATEFFAAGQTLTGIIPVQEGTLFFYVNHSFVDRWKGFGTGAKRNIGRTMINKIMRQVADEYGLCEGS